MVQIARRITLEDLYKLSSQDAQKFRVMRVVNSLDPKVNDRLDEAMVEKLIDSGWEVEMVSAA